MAGEPSLSCQNQPQREKQSKWAFGELRDFIEYKAELAGVPVIIIDPANTSRRCPQCGHVDQGNRPVRAIFLCRECGHFDHADIVGATNIASAAKVAWRKVSEQQPNSKKIGRLSTGTSPRIYSWGG